MKLNLGCGRDIREGWVNVDSFPFPGVHVVDLDSGDTDEINDGLSKALCAEVEGNGSWLATEFLASHVIEHLNEPLALMEACWQVAVPNASFEIRCPHGASDDADEDPTHVRRLFPGSFGYFSQPFYWRADYGYRGDWQVEEVHMVLNERLLMYQSDMSELQRMVMTERNVVEEMIVTLRAEKPARAPDRDLQQPLPVSVSWRER